MNRLSPLKLIVLLSIIVLPVIYLSVSHSDSGDTSCEKKSISVTSKGTYGAIMRLSQSQDSQIFKDGCGNHLAIMKSQLDTPRFSPAALAASYGVSLSGNAVSTVPILHSNPNASRKIYLKFDGYTFPQNNADSSWWGFFSGLAQPGVTVPGLDLDGNPSTFSAFEQAYITDVWLAVAEDFSVFDIDVTTENPGDAGLTKATLSDTTFGLTAAVSSAADWSAKCGQYGCGGVAYLASINVLPSVVGANINPMGVVFAFNKFNNDFNYYTTAKDLAGIISHELGHGIGLMHDGTTRSSSNEEYFPGHQNGFWAPIMGTSYNQAINHWSKNEYANGVARANPLQDGSQLYLDASGWGWWWISSQDDFEVAEANNLPVRTDDYGNNISTATNLTGEQQTKAGIVGPNNDLDFFKFTINATQQVSVTANPIDKSPNLDILMKLYNSSGEVIATFNPEMSRTSNPVPLGMNAAFSRRVFTPGTYYISVQGTGSGNPLNTGYSSYSSAGQYTLNYTLHLTSQPTLSISNTTRINAVGTAVTLTTAGGAGSGAVTYAVTGANCTLTEATLEATAAASCVVTATKAADATYSQAVSAPRSFSFLGAQAALTISNQNTTNPVGTSVTLTTTGGSGLGAVTYALSTPNAQCSLRRNILTARAGTTCSVVAIKGQDRVFASIMSAIKNFIFN